ncbi:hypothetical protein [Streptomyces sp. enrichment culture]|uniref:hypothetical protein n=1 Tax=Streptomyces sp. enrichment culture TaxID=1795815 RepID=UPI003F57AAB6
MTDGPRAPGRGTAFVFGHERSFHAVYEGQAARINEKLQELDRDDFTRFPRGATDRAAGTVTDSAAVLGTLTQIRTVVLSGPEGEDDAAATKAWTALCTGYGRPRLERMVQDRALEAGVPGEEIGESGRRASLLLNEVGQSYAAAAKTTEGVLLRQSVLRVPPRPPGRGRAGRMRRISRG